MISNDRRLIYLDDGRFWEYPEYPIMADGEFMKEEEFDSLYNKKIKILNLYKCKDITHIPSGLPVSEYLIIDSCPKLQEIGNLKRLRTLYISDCPYIIHLPEHIRVDNLILKRCPKLNKLPEDLRVEAVLTLREMTFHSDFPKNIRLGGIDKLACTYTVNTPRLNAIEREIAIAEGRWRTDLEYR